MIDATSSGKRTLAVPREEQEGRKDQEEQQTPGGGTFGGFAGAVACEWTKLWSVRASYLCLLAGLVVTAVFTYYYASIARINDHPVQPVGNAAAASVVVTQFAVVVLATVAVTSEYSTGTVRASLLWVPRRHRVQAAKALVAGLVVLLAGAVFAVVGTVVARVAFDGRASFDAGTTVGQILAVGVYQALVAVLTVGVAFSTRHPAGALSILVALLWGLPSVLLGLGSDALEAVNDAMPYGAGDHFMRVGGDAPYSSTAAVLIVAAWTAAAHVTGLYVLRRRDA
ncbi:ABC transporter permease [Streptomyces solicathayae]|uniref:ABC transporter permease n=1 Tax=Streptomyces solicathayae TaxID=3081768 RepID=A0ABZ0LKJ1_9ACTN|nr:ABC transporter permease [Streptomyces sp. HUAS YS2]WOX20027.1 ABC transporter permease [Streptomyces sp. HUAS YS2]